jgi:hypothetical protein
LYDGAGEMSSNRFSGFSKQYRAEKSTPSFP